MLRETVNVDHDGLALDQAGFDGKALDGRGDHGKARRCAFDLIELDGKSLRRMAIEHRKQPDRYGELSRFDTMPSQPSWEACL